MNRTRIGTLALLLTLIPLAGCGGPAPAPAPPLEGTPIGGPFTLTDQNGKTVRDSDFAGKYRIVYFGYTSCPDVCPNDMLRLADALRELKAADAATEAKIVPIFITIDPERDTPEVVGQFVANFHPRMVGLTGSAAAIKQAADEYRVVYSKESVRPDGRYEMQHTSLAYLMGPDGKPIAFFSSDMKVPEIVSDLRKWVK